MDNELKELLSMDKMTSVLLAIGEDNLSALIRKILVESEHSFDVLDTEVLHRRFLYEMVAQYQPNILIVHDKFLPGDKLAAEERDAEMLEILQYIRLKYDQQVRIVYVCIRERTDPFLGKIVGLGIHDIFHAEAFRTDTFLEQLASPPKFSNVQKFGRADFNFQQMKNEDEEEESEHLPENDEAWYDMHHDSEENAVEEEEDGFLGKVRGILKPFKEKNEQLFEKFSKDKTDNENRPKPSNSKKHEMEEMKKELQVELTDVSAEPGTAVGEGIAPIEEVLESNSLEEEPRPAYNDSEMECESESSLEENRNDVNLEIPEEQVATETNTTPEADSESKRLTRTEQRKKNTRTTVPIKSSDDEERKQSSSSTNSQQVLPTIQPRELVTLGPVVVAVASLTSNSGVTSTAISIAKYLKSLSKRVAIIELNQSLGFERLHAYYENSYELLFDEDSFECEGIIHYKHRTNLQVHAIINQYDYVVLDMGLLSETNSYINEFKRAPIRLMITPDQEWKWYLVDRLNQQDPYALEDYTFLLPTSDVAIAKRFKKEFGIKNAEAFPMLKNMYDLTSEDFARIDTLINRFFVMNKGARKNRGKKRWFF